MSERWLERSVLVTVGTGGVGKTTTAAAIGLEAAARGRRALVLTIDPARRLADALGLEALDHRIQRVPPERVGMAADAELYATMLDTQRTFDELVDRLAPDPQTRAQILDNPIYRNLTDALSGSREYSALEKLHELHDGGEYDLIVLDTPPAAHALQFLDAPRRLTGFLDGRFMELLLKPAAAVSRVGLRWLGRGPNAGLGWLQRLTGLGFLSALSELMVAFQGILGGVRARADAVGKLLRSDECGFLLVAGPEPEQVRLGVEFWRRLREERIRLVGVVLNRVRRAPSVADADPAAAEAWLAQHLDPQIAERLARCAARYVELARRDAAMGERLEKSIGLQPDRVRRVPLLDEDIHSPQGLARLRRELFERIPDPEAPLRAGRSVHRRASRDRGTRGPEIAS